MKRFLLLSAFFLLVAVFFPVSADSEVNVRNGEGYVCGDSFEITFPEPAATAGMFTSGGSVQAAAKNDEKLMQIRVQMRNLTTGVFDGMNSDCFRLKGYVRDRSLTYAPELIINYDYFGSANYYAWDKLPPLRTADIMLIFRVNPILINWELLVDLKPEQELVYTMEHVSYEPAEYHSCSGVFRFDRVRDLETGIITRYTAD